MINAGLAYAAYDARRAVTRQQRLPENPERMVGRSWRLELRRPSPRAPCQGNVFGSQPDPNPVTR